jgi:hypothetical protein
LRILSSQGDDRPLLLRASVDDAGSPTKEHVPELAPVFDIVIDQQRGVGIGAHVPEAAQSGGID